jgi:hypothetical protein
MDTQTDSRQRFSIATEDPVTVQQLSQISPTSLAGLFSNSCSIIPISSHKADITATQQNTPGR